MNPSLEQWEQQAAVSKHQSQTWEAHKRWCQNRGLDPKED